MKIAVFSDSHRVVGLMAMVVKAERPDGILHLGDLEADAMELSRRFPGIHLWSVCGNCDYMPLGQKRLLLCLEGKTIFAAHGHLYDVKSGVEYFEREAKAAGADAAFFGHTHVPYRGEYKGMLVANPGSISLGRRHTYGLLTLENGGLSYEGKDAEELL